MSKRARPFNRQRARHRAATRRMAPFYRERWAAVLADRQKFVAAVERLVFRDAMFPRLLKREPLR